jgi:hypothetical protein
MQSGNGSQKYYYLGMLMKDILGPAAKLTEFWCILNKWIFHIFQYFHFFIPFRVSRPPKGTTSVINTYSGDMLHIYVLSSYGSETKKYNKIVFFNFS